jgi:hypothetical protein
MLNYYYHHFSYQHALMRSETLDSFPLAKESSRITKLGSLKLDIKIDTSKYKYSFSQSIAIHDVILKKALIDKVYEGTILYDQVDIKTLDCYTITPATLLFNSTLKNNVDYFGLNGLSKSHYETLNIQEHLKVRNNEENPWLNICIDLLRATSLEKKLIFIDMTSLNLPKYLTILKNYVSKYLANSLVITFY